MQLPREVLSALDIGQAVQSELDYRPPYLPPSILKDALTPHLADYERRLRGFYRSGIDLAPADILQVPKRRGGFRPVAAVDLQSRVLYRGLAESLTSHLPNADRSWEAKQAFERAPLDVDEAQYVVIGDVASFYDFVDHALLLDELVSQTGEAEICASVIELLQATMGRQYGLPQVLEPSNLFSEAYVDIAERRLLRQGHIVWRHADDFRLAAPGWLDANLSFEALDMAIRDIGLALNEHKCFLLTMGRYQQWLDEPERRWGAMNEEVELDLRSFQGYGDDEPGEEPVVADNEILERSAVRALELALGEEEGDRLQTEVNRQLMGVSLFALQRIASTAALPHIGAVINREPQFGPAVSRYLAAAATTDEDAVLDTCVDLVTNRNIYVSDWQGLWLIHTLHEVETLRDELIGWMRFKLTHGSVDLLQARAAYELAFRNEIDLGIVADLYAGLSPVSRPDAVAAAALASDEGSRLLRSITKENVMYGWIAEWARGQA